MSREEIRTICLHQLLMSHRHRAVVLDRFNTHHERRRRSSAVPLLVGVGDAIGIMGGYVVGVTRLDFNPAAYIKNTVDFLQLWDILSGMVKGAVFGFIVAIMGCYFGMNSGRGAQGVGRATKSAVVSASVLILAANYILTELFFSA